MKPLAVMMLLATACAHLGPAQTRTPTTDEYLHEFLEAWLTGGPSRAKPYLSPDFAIPIVDESARWPPVVQSLPPVERALAFPFACGGGRTRCSDLVTCIGAASDSSQLYDLEKYRVTDDIATEFPSLKAHFGREVVQATFMLRSCNVAAYVIVETDTQSKRRVLSITFAAP